MAPAHRMLASDCFLVRATFRLPGVTKNNIVQSRRLLPLMQLVSQFSSQLAEMNTSSCKTFSMLLTGTVPTGECQLYENTRVTPTGTTASPH